MTVLNLNFGIPTGPNAKQADDVYTGFLSVQNSVNAIYSAYGDGSGGLAPFPQGVSPTGVTPGTYITPSLTVNQFGQVTDATGQSSVPQALVYAGPATGPDSLPAFRALAGTDIPLLDQASGGSVPTSLYSRAKSNPEFADYGKTAKNVADLLQIYGPQDKAEITLLDYATIGDGGYGPLRWDAASTATPNNITIFNPTGNAGAGRWIRSYQGDVSLTWGGVVSDATSFPGTTVTNGSAVITGTFGALINGGAIRPGMGVMVPQARAAGVFPIITTVLSVDSSTQLTLSAPMQFTPTATVTITIGTDATPVAQAMIDAGLPMYVPPGNFWISFLQAKDNTICHLDGRLVGEFSPIDVPFRTTTVFTAISGSLTAGWGTGTPLPGNFSAAEWQAAAAANAWVLIRLQPGNFGSSSVNQFGFDYAKVTAASGTGLTLDRTIRWGYPATTGGTWQACLIQDIDEAAGILPAKSTTVIPVSTSNMPDLALGSKVRIENKNGLDTVWALPGMFVNPITATRNAYFEWGIVDAFTSTSITLRDQLKYTYQDYWVMVGANTDNIRISGGHVDTMQMHCASNIQIVGTAFELCSFANSYRGTVQLGDGKAGDARLSRVMGATNSRHITIDNTLATDASSATDNGALKFLGVQDLTLINITAYGMIKTGTSGSDMPGIFGDFYNTPYSCWSDGVVVLAGHLGRPHMAPGAANLVDYSCVMTGTRDLQIFGLVCAGQTNLSYSWMPRATLTGDSLLASNLLWGSTITGDFHFMIYDNCADFTNIGSSADCFGAPSGRGLYIRNNCTRGTITGYKCVSQTAADLSVYINAGTDIRLIGCSDNFAHTTSVQTAGVCSGLRMSECNFKGPITVQAASPAVLWAINGTLTASKTFDWPSVAAGGSSQTTVTVLGAVVGDAGLSARMSAALPAGMYFAVPEVTAADTVTVTLINPTAGALDPASGTLTATVQKIG